ncbi:MAG: hypothetical protein AB8B64_07935 [Granulosicoccus sp.]
MTVNFQRICSSQRLRGWLVGIFCLLSCGNILAQSLEIDSVAPIIELEELVQTAAASSQVFTVQIAEETELLSATLFYRRNGEQAYNEAPMNPLGASGFYTASINTDPSDLRPIEYYIQARDTSENRTVSGFSFDPYSRTLTPATDGQLTQPVVEEEPQAPLEKTREIAAVEPFYKRSWFKVTLGIVAVGLLANSMDTGGEDTRIVPVTFTFED